MYEKIPTLTTKASDFITGRDVPVMSLDDNVRSLLLGSELDVHSAVESIAQLLKSLLFSRDVSIHIKHKYHRQLTLKTIWETQLLRNKTPRLIPL